MQRRTPPFNLARILKNRRGLLRRMELAFALEPVHKLKPVVMHRGEKSPESEEKEEK